MALRARCWGDVREEPMLLRLRKRCETEAGLAAGLREPFRTACTSRGLERNLLRTRGDGGDILPRVSVRRTRRPIINSRGSPSFWNSLLGRFHPRERRPQRVCPPWCLGGFAAAAGLCRHSRGAVVTSGEPHSVTGVEDPDFPPGDPLPGLAPKCPFPGEAISFHLSIKAQTWKMSFFSY